VCDIEFNQPSNLINPTLIMKGHEDSFKLAMGSDPHYQSN